MKKPPAVALLLIKKKSRKLRENRGTEKLYEKQEMVAAGLVATRSAQGQTKQHDEGSSK